MVSYTDLGQRQSISSAYRQSSQRQSVGEQYRREEPAPILRDALENRQSIGEQYRREEPAPILRDALENRQSIGEQYRREEPTPILRDALENRQSVGNDFKREETSSIMRQKQTGFDRGRFETLGSVGSRETFRKAKEIEPEKIGIDRDRYNTLSSFTGRERIRQAATKKPIKVDLKKDIPIKLDKADFPKRISQRSTIKTEDITTGKVTGNKGYEDKLKQTTENLFLVNKYQPKDVADFRETVSIFSQKSPELAQRYIGMKAKDVDKGFFQKEDKQALYAKELGKIYTGKKEPLIEERESMISERKAARKDIKEKYRKKPLVKNIGENQKASYKDKFIQEF